MLKSQRIELVLLNAIVKHADPAGRSFHIADLTPYVSKEAGECEHREVVAALQRLLKNSRITIGHWEGRDWVPYDISHGTEMFYNRTFTYAATPDTWPYVEELQKGDRFGVFISHTSEERNLAVRVQTFLHEAFGNAFPVFVSSDYKSIKSGKPWYSEILLGLKKAQVVLVLLTPQSVDKRWINFESGIGIGQESEVVPITARGLAKSDIGLPLGQLQARDLHDRIDIEQLLVDIATLCSVELAIADVNQFQSELTGIEHNLPKTGIEILARLRNNQVQFGIRNTGNQPVELVEAVVLAPKRIVGQGVLFQNTPPVRLDVREKIGDVDYEGFRLTPKPRSNSQIVPLPSTLTPDMGTLELTSIAIMLEPSLSSEERKMALRYRLTGRHATTGEIETRVTDMPADWPNAASGDN